MIFNVWFFDESIEQGYQNFIVQCDSEEEAMEAVRQCRGDKQLYDQYDENKHGELYCEQVTQKFHRV